MQEAVTKQIDALAFSVALEKAQHGAPPMSKAEFDGLCEMVASELTRVVEGIESGKASTGTTKRPARNPAEPKAPSSGKRGGIEPEVLKAFIGKSQEGAASLQQIADNFKVSKGVAQRALTALPGVKSATGPAVAGKRGKAPKVYWAE